MKSVLIVFLLFVLGLALGSLVAIVDLSSKKAARAERLQDCTQYQDLPIRIGDLLLTLPALDNADVWMHGPNIADRIESEMFPESIPGTPPVFCVPEIMGQPPYTVTSIRLHGNERSENLALDWTSDLFDALSAFGKVYGVQVYSHRDDWSTIAGGSLLPKPDPAEPAGVMTVRHSQPDQFGTVATLARSETPDHAGFRYAAHCTRLVSMPDGSLCNLSIADNASGLDYNRRIYYIAEDVYDWSESEPVPQSFVDFGFDMRRLVNSLGTPSP